MKNTIEQEIQRVLANMDRQDEQEQEADAHTPEEKEAETPAPGQDETQIQDIYVLVVRERAEPEEDPEGVVETTLTPKETVTRKPLDKGAIFASIFFSCLLLSLIALQIFLVLNPPIATVTIVPKNQQISLHTTLQHRKAFNFTHHLTRGNSTNNRTQAPAGKTSGRNHNLLQRPISSYHCTSRNRTFRL